MNFTGFVYLNTELVRVLEVLRFLGGFWACVTMKKLGLGGRGGFYLLKRESNPCFTLELDCCFLDNL